MRLEACEDAFAEQVYDWLKEHFMDLPDVTELTVLNFVIQVRSKHGIPKPFGHRFSLLEKIPSGKVKFKVQKQNSKKISNSKLVKN